jgi:hypothetical protein
MGQGTVESGGMLGRGQFWSGGQTIRSRQEVMVLLAHEIQRASNAGEGQAKQRNCTGEEADPQVKPEGQDRGTGMEGWQKLVRQCSL